MFQNAFAQRCKIGLYGETMLPHQINDMLSITFSSALSRVGTVKKIVSICESLNDVSNKDVVKLTVRLLKDEHRS